MDFAAICSLNSDELLCVDITLESALGTVTGDHDAPGKIASALFDKSPALKGSSSGEAQ